MEAKSCSFYAYSFIGVVAIFLLFHLLYPSRSIHRIDMGHVDNLDDLHEGFSANFYKCAKYTNNKVTRKVFEEADIQRTRDSVAWDLYIPCGYNNVESELRQVRTTRPDQKIFGIHGCDRIVSKDGIWRILKETYGRERASSLMPDTYILHSDQERELFRRNYRPNQIYLLKKNIQRKRGILLTDKLDVILAARKDNYRVVQAYVPDLYLIRRRKVNLRIYMMVTCQKGVFKAYIHRDGKCIYTNQDYQEGTDVPEQHLTSLNVGVEVYQDRPQSLEDLRAWLGEREGPHAYELLMSRLVKNLTLVMKAAKPRLCQLVHLDGNVTFQLFGLDYVFTDDMHPYLLEMNKGPDMSSKNDMDSLLKTGVTRDCFAMVGLTESSSNGFVPLHLE